jgi:predicted ferric reductase
MYRIYFYVMPFVSACFFLFLKEIMTPKKKLHVRRPNQILKLLRFRVAFGLSANDVLVITMAVIYSALILWSNTKQSLASGAQELRFLKTDSPEPLHAVSWECCEIMGKSFGILAIVLLGWFVLMPMGRKSILFFELLGIPREIAVKYHRWLGWWTMAITLVHVILYFAVWIYANGHPVYDPEGNLVRHMMVPRSCHDGSCDAGTNSLHIEMMYGYAATLTMLVMCITALHRIRRMYFEVFFYSHQLYRLVVLFLCVHYRGSILYLLPGICMIIIDKTVAYISIFFSVKAQGKIIASDLFELKVRKDRSFHYDSGQYIFVNVPHVSVLEWHPMTVTWQTEEELAVHIKTRGDGSWTDKVYEEIRSGGGHLPVRLDGFYGSNQIESGHLDQKDAVLFFCGGIGLTYPLSIIDALCEANPNVSVYLFWVTRTNEQFAAFDNLLLQKQEAFINLFVSVWVTLSNASDVDSEASPDFDEASTPKAKGKKSMRDEKGPKYDAVWTGFPTWLWSPSVHALVNAIAILLAVTGYVMSKVNTPYGVELPDQARFFLVNRFVDLIFIVFLVAGLILLLIGCRLAGHRCWAIRNAKASESNNDKLPQNGVIDTTSDSTTEEGTVSLEHHDHDPRSSPIVVGTGSRPDIAEIFKTTEAELLNQHGGRGVVSGSATPVAAVNACGPRAMVKLVEDECQKRVWANWTMYEEEWEW